MSLFNKLKNLQWKQLQHDEKYHKEICLLKVQERITHMTLHLSKYSSRLVEATAFDHHEKSRSAIIDTLIIVFSSANIFGRPLSNLVLAESLYVHEDLNALSNNFLNNIEKTHLPIALDLAIKINTTTGIMCKAVESLDHLEELTFRKILLDCIADTFRYSLALACYLNIFNIEEAISDRLYQVEKKHMFFNELGNYKEDYKDVLER